MKSKSDIRSRIGAVAPTARLSWLWPLAIACILGVSVAANEGAAQEPGYPRKPIHWIVPNAAGSPLDINIRKIASVVSRKMNATIVIENRVGASGVIGANEVARAAPDGYTFLATTADPLIASTALKAAPYDPNRDFSFITKIIAGNTPLAVRSDLKIKTLPELIAAAKTRPLTYASFGPGSFPQLTMEELNRVAGIKIGEVAYRSPPQAIQALLQGEVDISSLSPAQALEYTAQGKVFLLASPARSPLFPDMPSFADAGFNTTILNTRLWVGLLGPAGLPPRIADTMLAAIRSAFEEEELKAFFRATGSGIVINTPTEFEREFRTEHDAVVPFIKGLGIAQQ